MLSRKIVFFVNSLLVVLLATNFVFTAVAEPPQFGSGPSATTSSSAQPVAEQPFVEKVSVNSKAPSVVLKDAIENYVILSQLCGDRVKEGAQRYIVVLDFCATWCKPCMKEMPVLQKIYDDYKTRGVKMFLVSVDTMRKTEVVKFFNEANVSIPILFDSDKTAVDKYGVTDFPSTFVINQIGTVIYKHIGYSETVGKEIRDVLDKAVSSNPIIAVEEKKLVQTGPTPEQLAAEKAVSEKKEKAKEYSSTATRYFENGEFDKAIAEWQKALDLDPEYRFATLGIKKAKEKLQPK